MSHTEQVVDPKLNTFLGQNLPTTNNRVEITGNEYEEEDDEVINDSPINEQTKNKILFYISRGLGEHDMTKLFQMFDRIKEMSQADAEKYLKALQYVHGCNLDDGIIDMFIGNAGEIFLNPKAQQKKEQLIKDKYIRECVATGLNDLLGRVGSMAGVAVFAFYVISSWAVRPELEVPSTQHNEKEAGLPEQNRNK